MSDRRCSLPHTAASLQEPEAAPLRAGCPTNNQAGEPVDSLTLKALLVRPLTELGRAEYRFCPDAACPTVYYSVDGLQTFAESDLRERVYQKHPRDADVLVCYCFRHSLGDILQAVRTSGAKRLIASVRQGVKDHKCACDIRNPQGSCCLGNITSIAHHATRGDGVDRKNHHSRRPT